MFTGIVEEKGRVISFAREAAAWRLKVAARQVLTGAAPGDSIAVNGCCLTVTAHDADSISFDVLEETRRLTNFAGLAADAHVNLERSLRFDGKVGGHFVTGHIDGMGHIEIFEQRGADHYLQISVPAGAERLIVHKGSIAVDGVSLTVAEDLGASFAVWLIPTTMSVTNLGEKRPGEAVNLEFDLLGKYVEKLTSRLKID